MTRVKICGLTRPEDVELACALGAAYLGFNFAAASPRRLGREAARELVRAAAPGVLKVGVFVDEDPGTIAAAADAAQLDLVQLHRPLVADDFARVPVGILAVARAGGGAVSAPAAELLSRCRGLLVDSSDGTGRRFDWTLLAGRRWPIPVFLAGGLDPDNVAEAIRTVRPDAVDVASGVESSPGIKDRAKLERFFSAVEEADREAP